MKAVKRKNTAPSKDICRYQEKSLSESEKDFNSTESWSKSSSIDLEESKQEEIFQVSQMWKIAGTGKGQLLLQIVKCEK